MANPMNSVTDYYITLNWLLTAMPELLEQSHAKCHLELAKTQSRRDKC